MGISVGLHVDLSSPFKRVSLLKVFTGYLRRDTYLSTDVRVYAEAANNPMDKKQTMARIAHHRRNTDTTAQVVALVTTIMTYSKATGGTAHTMEGSGSSCETLLTKKPAYQHLNNLTYMSLFSADEIHHGSSH